MKQLFFESNAGNMLAPSFLDTRYRNSDIDTSKAAARAAVSRKADIERRSIRWAVLAAGAYGQTAREVSKVTGIDYIEVQRRISECGLTKTDRRRDGCAVWEATT